MECSLLYVSRVRIAADRLDAEVDDIVAWSIDHNKRVGITGGLMRAAGYFAQLLEGPTEAVKALMESIDRDPRHGDVTVLHATASSKRQLGDWALAYVGESAYLAGQIMALVGPGLIADPERIDRLETLIVAFAAMSSG